MTLLPIVDRELRVAARRKGTHVLWCSAAGTVIALFVIIALFNEGSVGSQHFGRTVFYVVSTLAFGFTLLAGLFLTSDCLCSEKREGTLGLLFLTDLNGWDVVLGKLVATSVVSTYALLAIIPVLGLPLLMGGVSGAEFGRLVLVLLVTLLLSLSCGLFASAVAHDTRAAMFLSLGLILTLTGGIGLVTLFASWTIGTPDAMWMLLPSPLLGFWRFSDAGYRAGQGAAQYWFSIFLVAALALALLATASRLVRRSWHEAGSGPGSGAKAVPARSPNHSLSFVTNPFAWLTGRDPFPGKLGWTLLGVLFAIWLVFFLGQFPSSPTRGNGWFVGAFLMAFGLHALVKGLIAVQATRRLCEDRQSGALELLLATRLRPSEIVAGQWDTLQRQFRWLLCALTLINLLLVFMTLAVRPGGMGLDLAGLFSSFFAGGIVLLWLDFRAIGWVGMRVALSGVRLPRAVMKTLARILGPPWVAIFLFVALTVPGRGISVEAVFGCWVIWFVLSLVSASLAVAKQKGEIFTDFRRLAAGEQPTPAPESPRPWSPEWETAGATSTSGSER